MRLGCRVAVVETSGIGLSSGMGTIPSVAEALLRKRQYHLTDYDDSWLDEELAITDGKWASRKARGDCCKPELIASIGIRNKQAAAMKASADNDQALIDQHPEWDADPGMTVAQIAGVTADLEPA